MSFSDLRVQVFPFLTCPVQTCLVSNNSFSGLFFFQMPPFQIFPFCIIAPHECKSFLGFNKIIMCKILVNIHAIYMCRDVTYVSNVPTVIKKAAAGFRSSSKPKRLKFAFRRSTSFSHVEVTFMFYGNALVQMFPFQSCPVQNCPFSDLRR